jgi:hypothetical protein
VGEHRTPLTFHGASNKHSTLGPRGHRICLHEFEHVQQNIFLQNMGEAYKYNQKGPFIYSSFRKLNCPV